METELETPAAGRNTDGPDDLIKRDFAAELTPGDGRTVDVRIVPYGERIVHDDGHGGVPKGVPYTEEWMPGAFAEQVNAKGRERHVWMNFRHQGGLAGLVGHGLVLREQPDAFYGSFKFLDHPDGDKALMLVREGVLEGVSLEAKPKKSIRTAAGVVQRVKAHLFGIALTPVGAFDSAVVLALREETVFDEALLPVAANPEVIERCRRLGIALPQRYQAHPDETDTPAESGTSEDGTRQTEPTPS